MTDFYSTRRNRPARPGLGWWAVIIMLGLLPGIDSASAAGAPSVLVTTTPVKTGSLERRITAYGRIVPAPGAARTLTLGYSGLVTEVAVAPGMIVREGQTIATISAAPATRAAWQQAVAQLDAARQTLAHTRALLRQHLATRTQLSQAEQAAQAAEAARDALKSEGADKARNVVTAPFAGVIGTIAVAAGGTVQPGAAIATIVRRSKLEALVGIDPAEARLARAGDAARVSEFGALPDEPGRTRGTLAGHVTMIAGQVDPKTGLVNVAIGLGSSTTLIGEMVTARIDTGAVHGVIVPRDAALPSEGHDVIWQLKAGHAVRVTVRVLASAQGRSVVAGPIDHDLPIVVSGNYQLSPGIAVRIASGNGG